MTSFAAQQPNRKSPWLNPFGLALIAYYLVMAIIGLLVPDDILKSYQGTAEFSDFMAAIIPQIDHITALNIKPDVNRFYFSVLWAGSPVLLLIVCMMMWDAKQRGVAPIWTTPFIKSLAPMSLGIFFTIAGFQLQWIVDPDLRLAEFTFGTSIGRGLQAQVFVIGPMFFGPGVLFWLLGWLTGYIPRNIAKRKRT